MIEFGTKGNIMDEDFLIHILNNLPEMKYVILDGMEKPWASGPVALTIDVIHKKLNHWYEKILFNVVHRS